VLGDGIALELPRLLDWRSLLKAHTKVSDCAIVSALEHQTENSYHPLTQNSGAGFDSEAGRQGRGIGVVSMEERLKLLKGTLAIESQPRRGTTIHARVPFTSSRDSALAAG